jgi:hypothetical protein
VILPPEEDAPLLVVSAIEVMPVPDKVTGPVKEIGAALVMSVAERHTIPEEPVRLIAPTVFIPVVLLPVGVVIVDPVTFKEAKG